MLMAVAAFWKIFSGILFLLVCFLLIVVVLLQKGRGGGLSGAFGGAGGHSAFGAKTGDFFTWITVGLAGLFLLLAIVDNFIYRKVTLASPAIVQPEGQPESGAVPPGAGQTAVPQAPADAKPRPAQAAPAGAQAPAPPVQVPVAPAQTQPKK